MASFNRVILIGNMVEAAELKQTPQGTHVTGFRLAVSRRFKKEGQQEADFFNIVAWRQTADYVTKYGAKGRNILVSGQLQSRTYTDNDGIKHYIVEVVADEVSFTDRKAEGQNASEGVSPSPSATDNSAVSMADFVEIPQDEDLPF